MSSFVEIIAKLKPKNSGNFKLLDAQDVECAEDKGLNEVLDEKLNINQGVENVGKAMVIDTNGNVVPGSALPNNVYTQEQVDYMLLDKMDKPYTDIEIVERELLDDCLEGNFKVSKITGNTTKKDKEIIGVDKVHIKSIGKNLFDGAQTRGFYNTSTGKPQGTTIFSISRNSNQFINVFPNHKIVSNADNIIFLFYDKNKNYLSYSEQNVVTTPTNCYYINFYGNYLPAKLQLELGETITNFEEFKKTEIEYTLQQTLNAIPTQNRYDIIDINEMLYTQKMKKNDISGWSWSINKESDTHVCFRAIIKGFQLYEILDINLFDIMGAQDQSVEYLYMTDKEFIGNIAYYINIQKDKLLEVSAQGFKDFLKNNNVYLLTATNTTKDLNGVEPELAEKLKALRIYSPITNIFIEGEVNPTVSAQYPKDLALAQQKLEATVLNLQEEVVKNV